MKTFSDYVEDKTFMVFSDILEWGSTMCNSRTGAKERFEFKAVLVSSKTDPKHENHKLSGYRNFTTDRYEVFCDSKNGVHIGTAKDIDEARVLATSFIYDCLDKAGA